MRGHLVFWKSHSPQRGVQRVVADGPGPRANRWKDILAGTRQYPHVGQDRQSLPRKRHGMRLPHLHLALWDRPHRLVEIDLAPFHLAHFPWALEQMGCQLQGRHDGGITLIIVDRAQQSAECHRLCNCRKVLHLRNGQRADQ